MRRPIGLAAQTVPCRDPWRTVEIAAAAGFERVGVTIDTETWTHATTRAVRKAVEAGGIHLQDAEVIRLGQRSSPDDIRIIDIAAEIGAEHIIVISLIDDQAQAIEALAQLAAHASRCGVTPILEFGRFTSVGSLEEARSVAAAAAIPILVDPLHLARSGGTAAGVSAVPRAMLPYAQICDAGPPPEAVDATRLLKEAREERRNLGDGELDLAAFVTALPTNLPLMNEVRSTALAAAVPDPLERARHLAGTMRAWLDELGAVR